MGIKTVGQAAGQVIGPLLICGTADIRSTEKNTQDVLLPIHWNSVEKRLGSSISFGPPSTELHNWPSNQVVFYSSPYSQPLSWPQNFQAPCSPIYLFRESQCSTNSWALYIPFQTEVEQQWFLPSRSSLPRCRDENGGCWEDLVLHCNVLSTITKAMQYAMRG